MRAGASGDKKLGLHQAYTAKYVQRSIPLLFAIILIVPPGIHGSINGLSGGRLVFCLTCRLEAVVDLHTSLVSK